MLLTYFVLNEVRRMSVTEMRDSGALAFAERAAAEHRGLGLGLSMSQRNFGCGKNVLPEVQELM